MDPAGFVRVRTRIAGICNTDLELIRGYMGFSGVLGHEFVGEALDGALAGRRVVGGINFGCDNCERCDAGDSRHCATRKVLGILGADGVIAEEFLIPERNLVEVPDTVTDVQAVFAEPLAAACEIIEQLGGTTRHRRTLVLGDGKLGLLIAQVLAVHGAEVDLVGHHLDELEWIEDARVNRLARTLPEKATAAYDLVVEATGSASGLAEALRATEPRGTLVLKSTVAGLHEIDLAPIVINEITVLGSRCGRMKSAVELLERTSIMTEPLIDSRRELSEAESAFARAQEKGARKVLLVNP